MDYYRFAFNPSFCKLRDKQLVSESFQHTNLLIHKMSSQRICNIKIPHFDRDHYNIWKKKMFLLIRYANPEYPGILKNAPFVP